MAHYRTPTSTSRRQPQPYEIVDADSDKEVLYTNRKSRQMKLDILRSIRTILIVMLILGIVTLVGLIVLVVAALPLYDPITASILNARTITDRMASLSTNPAIDAVFESASLVSKEVPNLNKKFLQPLMKLNASAMFDQGIVAVHTASDLLDSIVDVDPKSLLTYLREKKILDRVLRLLQGANALLDKVENEETRKTMDRVTADATMLLGFVKSLISEVNSTGLTVKIH